MRWEPWRWGVQWLAIGSGLWSVKRIIEPDPLTAIVEVAEVLNINPSTIIHIWSKLESWKSLISGCLMKIIILKCCLLLFYVTTMNYFLIGLWCVTKSGFYMTTGNDQLSGWTEKKLQSTSQSQTCTQNTSWSLFGGLLLLWSTTAFWIPVKP